MHIQPLDAPLGAEIRDFDLRISMSAHDRAALDQALMRYQVLRIRGEVLSPIELWEFSRQFGTLRQHVARGSLGHAIPRCRDGQRSSAPGWLVDENTSQWITTIRARSKARG